MKTLIMYKSFLVSMMLVLFSTSSLYAQECFGIIDENTADPIIGAHIYLEDTELITVTNAQGQFCLPTSLKLKNSTQFSFSHISYEKKTLSWKEMKDNDGIISLKSDQYALGEVVVAARELYFTLPYTSLSSLKTAVSSFGAVHDGEYIYVVGGDISYQGSEIEAALATLSGKSTVKPVARYDGYSGRIYRYDIKNDSWERLPHRLRNRAYHNVCSYNNKLYILGGKRLSSNKKLEYLDHTVEIYDLQRDTVWVDPVNPHQAVNFASGLYQDNLILLGGSVKKKRSGGKKTCTNKVHTLDLKKGLWYEMPALPQASESRGICISDKFYLIGYQDTKSRQLQSYNIRDGKVNEERNLIHEVRRPALATDGESLYIFENGIMQIYKINTGELSAFQVDLYLKDCEMFYSDGKLYLLGGTLIDTEVTSIKEPSRGLYCIDVHKVENTRLYTSN